MRSMVLGIMLSLMSVNLIGQARFTVATDAAILDSRSATYQVVTGSPFQVSFVIENGDGSNFNPPDFRNFGILSGPSTSSEISIINGRRSQKKSYSYTLMAASPGTFTIEPATVNVSGSTLTSDPLKIRAIKASEEENNGKETLLEYEISDTSVYIGQQIVARIRLLTTENVKNYDLLSNFDFEGFFVKSLNETSRRASRVIRNGKEYYSTILNAVAVFPQQTGTYDLPPVSARIGIAKNNRRRSIFSFPDYNYKVVQTDGATIQVKDLPIGAPESFSGAVGDYSVTFRLAKRTISTDDNFKIIMDIRGDGDGKKIFSPALNLGEHFDVYDPNLIRDEEYVDNARIIDYKSYEFLAVPRKPGEYVLKPEFSYFDTREEEYVTVQNRNTFRVKVVAGAAGQNGENLRNRNVLPDMPVANHSSPAAGFMASPAHLGILGALFLGLFSMVGHRIYLTRLENRDPQEVKRQKARKVAENRMKEVNNKMAAGDERSFYNEITKTVLTYVEDKVGIHTGSLTKEEIPTKLDSIGIPRTVSEKLMEILRQSEIALYAGSRTGQMEEMYRNARDIIQLVEEYRNG